MTEQVHSRTRRYTNLHGGSIPYVTDVAMASHRGRLLTVWCLTWCLCLILLIAYQFVNKAAVLTSSTSNKQQTNSLTSRLTVEVDKRFRRAARVVLTTTNAGFLDMTFNMLASIQRFRTPTFPNVTVITEDNQSFDSLTDKIKNYPGLIVQKTTLGSTTSKRLLMGRQDYKRFVARRPRYLLQFLEAGFEVLFADSDTYWVRDPFEDLEGEFDIAAHNEVDPPQTPLFCDGFTYYRPTNNTISLVREWMKLLDKQSKGKSRVIMDQVVFNRLINRELGKNITGGLAMKTLNPVHYPDGRYFRKPSWRENILKMKVMHFSYLFGFDSKVKKLKEIGRWLV